MPAYAKTLRRGVPAEPLLACSFGSAKRRPPVCVVAHSDGAIACGVPRISVRSVLMKDKSTDRITRIVGLAPEADDGHVRMTEGERFRIWMGSETTHAALSDWCERIVATLKREGRGMEELTEAEFVELVTRLNDAESP